MIASGADVEVRFQRSPCMNRATTGTLRRGGMEILPLSMIPFFLVTTVI